MATKQLIRDFHSKVLETGDFTNVDNYLSPNLIVHTPYLPAALHGSDKFCEFMLSVYSAIDHLKVTTNEIIVEKNHASVRWTLEGISSGDFMNVPAGGDVRMICIITHYHIYRGKIVEAWAVDSSLWPRVFDF